MRNQKFTERNTIVKKTRSNARSGKKMQSESGALWSSTKSIRRMPWHWKPKKDVISCGEEHISDIPADFRMGKPAYGNAYASWSKYIASGRERGELKHLSSPRKRKKHRYPE